MITLQKTTDGLKGTEAASAKFGSDWQDCNAWGNVALCQDWRGGATYICDLTTGNFLTDKPPTLKTPCGNNTNYGAIGGKHHFGPTWSGYTGVLDLEHPTAGWIRTNITEPTIGSTVVCQGNRLYLRSLLHLTAIGDPSKPYHSPGKGAHAIAPLPELAKGDVPALLKQLGSPRASLRIAAANELVGRGAANESVTSALARLAKSDAYVDVRNAAAQALGKLCKTSAELPEPVLALLRDPAASARRAGAQVVAASGVGDAEAVRLLVNVHADTMEMTRSGDGGSPRNDVESSYLRAAVEDAIMALGEKALPVLAESLAIGFDKCEERTYARQTTASMLLARLGPAAKSAVPSLETMMGETNTTNPQGSKGGKRRFDARLGLYTLEALSHIDPAICAKHLVRPDGKRLAEFFNDVTSRSRFAICLSRLGKDAVADLKPMLTAKTDKALFRSAAWAAGEMGKNAQALVPTLMELSKDAIESVNGSVAECCYCGCSLYAIRKITGKDPRLAPGDNDKKGNP